MSRSVRGASPWTETRPDEWLKQAVAKHWENEPCGSRGVSPDERLSFYRSVERERYEWEPYIHPFARFDTGNRKKVLEIGIGLGTDFINWVRSGADAVGIDLTSRAVAHAHERLELEELSAELVQADAENLPFRGDSFDIVYSWGVLHHTPDTAKAVYEVHRVLKPGGRARVAIYHVPSWAGLALWFRHCLLHGRPWKSSRWAIFHYLESPGTKAYTVAEARQLFSAFSSVSVRTQLGFGDLLLMRPSEKYKGWHDRLMFRVYPRWLIRRTGNRLGLGLLVEASK